MTADSVLPPSGIQLSRRPIPSGTSHHPEVVSC